MPARHHASRAIAASLLLAFICGGPATAAASELSSDFYRARTFVTGQVEPGRSQAFARCLSQVLVKVSGDPHLLRHPRLAEIVAGAASLVTDFEYRDLMAGIPVHDEQGTRDRPYELTADFDPAKVDAALRSLGGKPWLDTRPRVVVFVGVRHVATRFVLDSEGTHGPGMREALSEAAAGVGIPIILPSGAALAGAGLTVQTLKQSAPGSLAARVKAAGGDVALLGELAWNEKALGWVADWRMAAKHKVEHWQVRGVNFDDAFRSGMQGALQILATGARSE
jgi:hypothetical protein